jgi:hypothetical protein
MVSFNNNVRFVSSKKYRQPAIACLPAHISATAIVALEMTDSHFYQAGVCST